MKNLDYAFVSPWLIGKIAQQKGRIDAKTVVCYHHKADDKVPALQDRIVPQPGAVLTLVAAAPSSGAAPR